MGDRKLEHVIVVVRLGFEDLECVRGYKKSKQRRVTFPRFI